MEYSGSQTWTTFSITEEPIKAECWQSSGIFIPKTLFGEANAAGLETTLGESPPQMMAQFKRAVTGIRSRNMQQGWRRGEVFDKYLEYKNSIFRNEISAFEFQ